jgi:hypothetical protein
MRGDGRTFQRHRVGCSKGENCGCAWWLASDADQRDALRRVAAHLAEAPKTTTVVNLRR